MKIGDTIGFNITGFSAPTKGKGVILDIKEHTKEISVKIINAEGYFSDDEVIWVQEKFVVSPDSILFYKPGDLVYSTHFNGDIVLCRVNYCFFSKEEQCWFYILDGWGGKFRESALRKTFTENN